MRGDKIIPIAKGKEGARRYGTEYLLSRPTYGQSRVAQSNGAARQASPLPPRILSARTSDERRKGHARPG